MMKNFRIFREHSIARNLMLGLLFALGVVAGLSLSINAFLSFRQANRELEARAEEYLNALREGLSRPIWDYDTQQVQLLGNAYARNEFVSRLRVTDPDGMSLFSFVRSGERTIISRTTDVMHGERHIATLELALGSAYYERLNMRFFWSYGLTLLLMVLILMILSTVLLQRLLQQPLSQFIGAVNAYAGGNHEAFDRCTSYRELRPLIRVLRSMGRTISSQVERLQQAERQYRDMFDYAVVGIFQSTSDGRILKANPALARLMGYSSPEQLMNDVSGAKYHIYVHPEQRETFLKRVASEGYISGFEAEEYRRDGSTFWASIEARPVYDVQGQLAYYEGFLQDITARKQMLDELHRYHDRLEELVSDRTHELEEEILERARVEEALRRAKDEAMEALRSAEEAQSAAEDARQAAEDANLAKSRFLANMSHELRTPLNAILGFAQILSRDAALSPTQQEQIDIISRSGEHLLKLINDVLDMSKIEAGRMPVSLDTCDLDHVLTNLEEMIRLRANEKGLLFDIARDPGLPRLIRTDEGKLRQVLLNLLGNAVKFTRKGRIELRVAFERNSRAERSKAATAFGSLHCSVIDTGIGIPQEEQAVIFETFGRTALSDQIAEGSGLGLAISSELVHLLGGRLEVSSPAPHPLNLGSEDQGGPGVEFRVSLPVECPEAQAEGPDQKPARRVRTLAPNQAPPHILIVEDQKENRQMLRKQLETVGFRVQEAANGRDAIDRLQEQEFALIIMDMRMTVMDGYTATRSIRNMPTPLREIPILALTASAFHEERQRILACGCNDVMYKPFQASELLERLRRQLSLEYLYEESPPAQAPQETGGGRQPLTPEHLACLPTATLDVLEQAAIELDVERLREVIDEMRSEHTVLADSLTELVKNLQCKPIWKAIQQAKGL